MSPAQFALTAILVMVGLAAAWSIVMWLADRAIDTIEEMFRFVD